MRSLDIFGVIVGFAAWILFFYFPLFVLVCVLLEIVEEKEDPGEAP